MWSLNSIIVALLLQSLFITGIDGNAYRRRRLRRQTSGSLYGTNADLGASAPAGYNHPANVNFEGTRLNYPDARDRYRNPMIVSSGGSDNTLTSVDLNNQPRPQQQQLYGTNDQAVLNSYYSGNSFYNPTGTNQLLRDSNGNLLPPGSMGSSFYGSNPQLIYPANTNQMLMNKDLYGASSASSSSNTNNYNQYGYSSNQLPNSNTYGGQMGVNTNNNPLSNTNSYGGSFGSGANFIPNTGYQTGGGGSGSDNSWLNTNTYNRFGQSSGNSWFPGRDANYNYNTNNRYPNNDNRFVNPNTYYNHSSRLATSFFVMSLTIFLSLIFN